MKQIQVAQVVINLKHLMVSETTGLYSENTF